MDCPDCSQTNPENARFCLGCGRSLSGGSRSPPLSAMSDERRLITVLFADIVGSTTLAARLDAEDWKALVNGAFARLTPPIYRYGGAIPQFLGDGFLALFGAPVAHEDDPQRAVRAALELIDAAGRYREEIRHGHGIEFAVRIGINTGPAVFGAVGTDTHSEFLAVGETVNVAARLQALAEPMTALMSEATRRLLPDGFELNEAGAVEVRGLAYPILAFVPRRAPTNGDTSAPPLSFASPMVGRRSELDRLATTSAQARVGSGRVVVLLGEPGVGKSRLLREWQAIVTDQEIRWAQANMPAYASGEAYRMAREAIRAVIGFGPAAGTTDLESVLGRAPRTARIEGARRYLADLLSISLSDADGDAEPLSPQGRQARYIELGRALIRDVTTEPVVLVLNDAHWSDPASVALLTPLLALHAELPLLVCVVARPDADTAGWRLVTSARAVGGSGLLEISLETLSLGVASELLSNLLETTDLPDGLVEFVHGRTDGNPLFVEEVVRMLVDSELLVRAEGGWQFDRTGSDRVPETLQGLLAARIDRLDAESRVTLRIASVIGRQFSVPVLERMLG